MTIAELIESEFEDLERFLGTFNFNIQTVQADIFEDLLKLISQLPQKDGQFVYDTDIKKLLIRFENRIIEKLESGQYNKDVNKILLNFENLESVRMKIAEYINPKDRLKIFKANTSNIKKGYIDLISESLGSKEALGVNYTQPIKSILFEHAALGLSVADATKKLFNVAMSKEPGGGLLGRYAGQVARDSLFGFTGAVDQAIGDHIGAKNVNYLGNVIEDSRPQCIRWVVKFKGYIPAEKLKSEVTWANTYGKGYSEYIPKLTVNNFAVVRGGHNCRHRVSYSSDIVPREKIEAIEDRYRIESENYQKGLEKKLTGKTLELYEKAKAKVDRQVELYGK
ncbi:MAG: hypothetical protein IPI96_16075 [Saprospiraceae bacterium]|nr:hypothetical protein [Saprospiraceae bacterium]